MTGFYDVVNKCKEFLELDDNVNFVSLGSIFEIDLNKQTMYPLSHLQVNSVRSNGYCNDYSCTLISMDIVKGSKSEGQADYFGNDNEIDVLNTQQAVQFRFVELLQRSALEQQYVIQDEVDYEPFTDRFTNKVAGWTCTFVLSVPKDMTIG
jgi:hypothetical protein